MGNDFKKITLLIIDQDNFFIDKIKSFVKESFRSVCFVAKDIEDAKVIIDEHELNIILINPKSSIYSEFNTIKSLIEICRNIPIIITSNNNNNIIADQSINLGVQDYLIKDEITKASFSKAIRFAMKRGETFKSLVATQKALSDSENQYLEVQSITRFGAWELDIVSNEMSWSKPMKEMLGQTSLTEKSTLKDYFNYVYISDKESVKKFFEKVNTGVPTTDFEHRVLINGSEVKYVTLRAKMYNKTNNQGFVLKGTIQDITDRKKTEKLYLEKSISQGKLNIQKKIMNELNFHIRTPMATLSNALHLLKGEFRTSQTVKIIERSYDDLSLMITNLINYNLLQGDKITVLAKEVNTDTLIQSLKKIVYLKTQSSDTIDVIIDKDGLLPETLEIDSQLTSQILTSLTSLFSKIEATQNLGITFSFNNNLIIEFKSNINVNLDLNKLTLNEIEHKLESFAVNEDFDSLEFDWYFTRFILNHISGTFKHSNNNNNSKMVIEIPVENYVNHESKKAITIDSSIKLLLVEDHFLNQLTTKRLLSNWSKNVHIEVALNGKEAVNMFNNDTYDIILMDIHMPIMDGYEATKAIREISQVPIIGLSADSSNVEKKKCIALGMDAYLEKPYKPEQLYKVITNTLEWVEKV